MPPRDAVCHWCQCSVELVGQALQRCGGCKTLYYCGKVCQKSDWKHHKAECRTIQAGGPLPDMRRAGVRIRGLIRRRGKEGGPTPDPDTIYYIKTSKTQILDVSVAGPFYPMDNIVEHILGGCEREGSLPAMHMLNQTIERVGIVSLQHLIAPLPCGHHMKIEVVRERNVEVAEFLQSSPLGTPKPVYSILQQTPHPDHEKILAAGSNWPFQHVPTLDMEVLETCLSKEAANREGCKMLADWEAEKRPGEMVLDMFHEGLLVGQLCDAKAVQKQILMVRFDDGKSRGTGLLVTEGIMGGSNRNEHGDLVFTPVAR